MLWHRRLGHISIERIKRLVNDGILNTLNFTNFKTCVGCTKKCANKSSDILEIIHTDICCPYMGTQSEIYIFYR